MPAPIALWQEEVRQSMHAELGRKQMQRLLRLLEWRFHPSEEEQKHYLHQFTQVQPVDNLIHLLDELLAAPTLDAFEQDLSRYLYR